MELFNLIKDFKIIQCLKLKSEINCDTDSRLPIKIRKKTTFIKRKSALISTKQGGYLDFGLPSGEGYCRTSYCKLSESCHLIVEGYFSVGDNAHWSIRKNAVLTLGSGYINSNSQLICTESITIGNGVAIADGVLIRDSDDHQIKDAAHPMTAPIVIEDHVWIGQNVIILKGVTIGQGSIIGAGSVVTKDIPEKCLAVGAPAKVIRENVEW